MATGSHPLDYFIFVLVASIGTLQIAAAYAQLRGLSFFNRSIIGYISGSSVIVIAFWWFFATEKRIGHDIIAGSQQYGLFIAGVAAAIFVTVTLSSIIKSRTSPPGKAEETGLKSLKNITYFQAIARYLRRVGKG